LGIHYVLALEGLNTSAFTHDITEVMFVDEKFSSRRFDSIEDLWKKIYNTVF
jgi:hypothetical protein